MKTRLTSRFAIAVLGIFAVLLAAHPTALAHGTDVHQTITEKAAMLSGIQFHSDDIAWLKQGSVDEDEKGSWLRLSDDCYVPPRTSNHHYDPHTLEGHPGIIISGMPAVETATDRWNEMSNAFDYPARRWYGDEEDGTQGSIHGFGRVLHLLEDMASPPHTHPPDGHGFLGLLKNEPGGSCWGYYSDFEYKWSSWTFPTVSGNPLTPNEAIEASIPNSKLDSDSLSLMRGCLNGIPSGERNKVEGYIKAQAWLTYFHISFYGQINYNESNPAPEITSSNKESILRKMYPDISFYGSTWDDYWTIDGVGYYDKKGTYFTDDWWPCPDDSVGSYPIGHKVEGSGSDKRILGRFYVYLHYYEGSTSDYWNEARKPTKWPDNTTNSSNKSLAEYYGEVLLPLPVRFCAALMGELFPAAASLSYPSSSSAGQYRVQWGTAPSTDAGSTVYYRLERSSDGGSSWSHRYTGTSRYCDEDL